MPPKDFSDEIAQIVGQENVSRIANSLDIFSTNQNVFFGKRPQLIVKPRSSKEIQQLVQLANKYSLALVPSSSQGPKLRSDSVPNAENTIIVDLSQMNQIFRVDEKNKVVMIQSGVTFQQLLEKTKAKGLRPLMPLLPPGSKSVVVSALDREPITIPRFHWDTSDPLLCTETIFGSGDIFRTGAAAGPGSLEDQWASGQAQKNPLGPSQFDPFRILQGSQGTLGIVSWATIKCEKRPMVQKAFFAESDSLNELYGFTYNALKRRLGDHLFILNRVNFASLLRITPDEIQTLLESLPEWILVITVSGHGLLPQEEMDYMEGDIKEIANKTAIDLQTNIAEVGDKDILRVLDESCSEPFWKLRKHGGCMEIFFLTTLNRTSELISLFFDKIQFFEVNRIGVYIQPLVQGNHVHCEFDLFFNPEDAKEISRVKKAFHLGTQVLLDNGAFFSRPLGPIAQEIYERGSPDTVMALRTVKSIFDPNSVMNPNKLCFTEAD
ncbi:MAG: FAD-binding oxidoreductase [Promethearchaeota archaeon]